MMFRRCCGSTAREAAKQLKNRSQSFFHRKAEEQEDLILKDIVLFQEDVETFLPGVTEGSQRLSQQYLRSVTHLFEPDALSHLLIEGNGNEGNKERDKTKAVKRSEDDVRIYKTTKPTGELQVPEPQGKQNLNTNIKHMMEKMIKTEIDKRAQSMAAFYGDDSFRDLADDSML